MLVDIHEARFCPCGKINCHICICRSQALVLVCITGLKKGGTASVLHSTPWYSRQKYMPSRHAQWRTQKRVTKVGTATFSLIVKHPLRCLIISKKNSKLVWECHQYLVKLAEHKRVQLTWVPRHMGNEKNEMK